MQIAKEGLSMGLFLFGIIGHFGLLKDVNISFFLPLSHIWYAVMNIVIVDVLKCKNGSNLMASI